MLLLISANLAAGQGFNYFYDYQSQHHFLDKLPSGFLENEVKELRIKKITEIKVHCDSNKVGIDTLILNQYLIDESGLIKERHYCFDTKEKRPLKKDIYIYSDNNKKVSIETKGEAVLSGVYIDCDKFISYCEIRDSNNRPTTINVDLTEDTKIIFDVHYNKRSLPEDIVVTCGKSLEHYYITYEYY